MVRPNLLWLRLDLRVTDHPALVAAVKSGGPVIPVYIHDPKGEGKWHARGASEAWLAYALADSAAQFEKLGSPLVIRQGDSLTELRKLIKESQAGAVFWNRRYEPSIRERDSAIKTALRADGLQAESFNGNLLHDPTKIKTLAGNPFQVFTPFWKNCLLNLPFEEPLAAPRKLSGPEKPLSSLAIDALKLKPRIPWDVTMWKNWDPTRKGAEKRLEHFVDGPVRDYPTARDIPKVDGTSRLSPYLHFGQISPREIIHAVKKAGKWSIKGGEKYVAEVGWREFGHHLIYHFPKTTDEPLRAEFKAFPWAREKRLLKGWQHGQTGYPIVDAGMRQLWQTGWMHNRVRMVAASVLVKHFLQPWQDGAAWFWDTLVDADLASNTMGWQWAGGCGADAAPYFRVFNPVLQGEKFDAEGTYVREFVPELAKLPAKWIHKPWEAPADVLEAAGVELDKTYPRPLVGLTEGRDRALKAFERLKAGL